MEKAALNFYEFGILSIRIQKNIVTVKFHNIVDDEKSLYYDILIPHNAKLSKTEKT